MRFDTESTICAIATGSEGALRGAIRVTGNHCVEMVASICERCSTHWQSKAAVRFEESIVLRALGRIDVAIFLWPDTRSYTGQPTVEIHCLGNQVILHAIQSRLVEHGAVLAQPGEFTLRAFLSGRLDLTQCEAVLGVIHASNDRTLEVALNQLAGGLAGPLRDLRTSMVNLLADIEAGLDFVDEDIEFISRAQILNLLEESRESVVDLLSQMESRSLQTVQLKVAVLGPPNAGKSSLINALAQKQISIVSSEPGTTRDYVRLRLEFDDVQVDFVDTAGVEDLDDETPRGIAQRFTQEQMEQADLILCCLAVDDSTSRELGKNDDGSKSIWLVRTKCDLETRPRVFEHSYSQTFWLSTKTAVGLEELTHALHRWAMVKQECVSQVVPMTAARCHASLSNTLQAIRHATEAAELDAGHEIIAGEIRLALEEIGMVAGVVYTDDVLDALFSRFCIGK